jgi:rhamnosyltransferase
MKLGGVLILYHPDIGVLSNILTYISDLDQLIVLDNSEHIHQDIADKIRSMDKTVYIPFHENRGISYALNYALKINYSFKYMMTMDQDSYFPTGEVRKYKEQIENCHELGAAVYAVNIGKKSTLPSVRPIWRTVTSGSVVDTDIAGRIGGFDENLFIDEVDHEYCYRAQKNGFKILQFTNICMHHKIGDPIRKVIFGRVFIIHSHNPVRKYYIVRNHIYVMKKYKNIRWGYAKNLFRLFFKTLIMEKNKKLKVLYMVRGIRDGIVGKYGKYDG